MHASKILFALCPALFAACGGSTVSPGSGGTGASGSSGASVTAGSTGSTSTTGAGGAGTASAGTTSSSGSSGATGGSASTGAGGACATTPTFTEVLAKPLSSCSGFEPPCHNAGSGMLHIDPTMRSYTWAQLVNVPAYITGAGKRVVPGDPATSFLYRKLTDDLGPNDGSPMPKSGGLIGFDGGTWNELPPGEIEMVRCWILGGALNN